MPRDKTGHFYYSHYPAIWEQDTQHLTLAEDGAYHRLVDCYMKTRAPLPTDDRSLARIVGASMEEWLLVKPSVITYFKPTGLFYHHAFCDEVLNSDVCRIIKSRVNGKKGGRPSVSKIKETTRPVTEVKPLTKLNYTKLKERDDVIIGGFQRVYDFGRKIFPSLETSNTSPIHQWIESGCDVDLDIISEIKRTEGREVTSWGYFTKQIANALKTRLTPMPEGKSNERPHSKTNVDKRLAALYRAGTAHSVKQSSQGPGTPANDAGREKGSDDGIPKIAG